MSEITYKEAKKKLCRHLRAILNKLEKMKIRCSDGWADWITCPECNVSMNLSNDYDPEDFGYRYGIEYYPIDCINVNEKEFEIKEGK